MAEQVIDLPEAGLAHGLRLPALAEGVKTNDQLDILIQAGCDEMQGFLIGRPRPIEAYADLLSRDSAAARA